MSRSVAFVTALAVLAATPASAEAEDAGPTAAVRFADLADGLCVDVLSGRVAVPADVSGDDVFNAGYGLTTGVPNSVMEVFGRDIGLLAQARLASGETPEGPFVVAMGGRAGETCRLIMMSGAQNPAVGNSLYSVMKDKAYNWNDLAVSRQTPGVQKLSLFKLDVAGNPFLANILTPTQPGPVAMVAIIAAIPPEVELPKGD